MITVMDFSTTWCGPCKQLEPVMNAIAKKYAGKMELIKIDAESKPDLSAEHNVAAVPTVIFIKDGKELTRFVGFKSQLTIESIIDRMI